VSATTVASPAAGGVVPLDTVEKVLTDGSSGLACRCGWAGCDRLRWVARGAKRTAPHAAIVRLWP